MKRTTYEAKLATTRVLDTDTVATARKANRTKAELLRFWRTAALTYIKKTEGKDLNAERVHWTYLKFPDLNIRPTGYITVEQWGAEQAWGAYFPDSIINRYRIPKTVLYTKEGK